MKVMNIGIIVRNDHNDTFPVALNPQMVQVIQGLLTQIPLKQSKLVGADGKQVASQTSIPIIPRLVDFDWDAAYAPMLPDDEKKLMELLMEKYKTLEAIPKTEIPEGEAQNVIATSLEDSDSKVEKLNPEKRDPLNPFGLKINATGRANVDLEEKVEEQERQDCTVKLNALGLSSGIESPGG